MALMPFSFSKMVLSCSEIETNYTLLDHARADVAKDCQWRWYGQSNVNYCKRWGVGGASI